MDIARLSCVNTMPNDMLAAIEPSDRSSPCSSRTSNSTLLHLCCPHRAATSTPQSAVIDACLYMLKEGCTWHINVIRAPGKAEVLSLGLVSRNRRRRENGKLSRGCLTEGRPLADGDRQSPIQSAFPSRRAETRSGFRYCPRRSPLVDGGSESE